MLLYAVENVKYESERPEGSGCSLSPQPGPNRYPTPSGDSSPMRPISNLIKFGNHTLWPSGEAAVAGSGLGRSLGLSPWNRTLDKEDKDGREDLGG